MTDNVQPRNADKPQKMHWIAGARARGLQRGRARDEADCNNNKTDKVEPQPINADKLRCALDSGSEGARVEARLNDETKQRKTS